MEPIGGLDYWSSHLHTGRNAVTHALDSNACTNTKNGIRWLISYASLSSFQIGNWGARHGRLEKQQLLCSAQGTMCWMNVTCVVWRHSPVLTHTPHGVFPLSLTVIVITVLLLLFGCSMLMLAPHGDPCTFASQSVNLGQKPKSVFPWNWMQGMLTG